MIRRVTCSAVVAFVALGVMPVLAGPVGPVDHSLDVRLEPEAGRLHVVDRMRLSGDGTLEMRLAPRFTVSRLSVDGRGMPPTGDAGRWTVPLGDSGEGPHEVVVEYEGRLAPLEDGRDTGDARSGADGSYLPAGSGWFPRINAGLGIDAGLAAYRLSVTVPMPHVAVATGRLVAEAKEEENHRAVFQATRPVEEPSLFAGPYEVEEQKHGELRLRTYLHRDLAGLAGDYLAASARHIDAFQERIGPYPFDGFAIVSAPLPVGLGFPGLAYVGRQVLPLPFFRGPSLAHEILHNWWGNGVLVDYGGGNWAEGLTTYLADYAQAEERDAQAAASTAAHDLRLAWLRDYAALPPERDTAAVAFTAKVHEAAQVIGYSKVAFVFHMLRRDLGDAVFTAALRRFWQDHRFKVAGWSDLRQAFEAASGKDLSGFFAQWLERTGAPALSLGEVASRRVGDGYTVTLTLRQEAPAWRLSVPVTVETAAGPESFRVDMDETATTATLAVSAEPVQVVVDAGADLFRRLAPFEAPPILRDVTLNAATVAVIAGTDEQALAAARTLAARLMDTEVRVVGTEAASRRGGPLLLIGTTAEIEHLLGRLDLAAVPEAIAGKGSARAWAARDRENRPVLVVAADDAAALESLLRPLPHYGRQGFLAFDGRQAIVKGSWPSGDSPLRRRLDGTRGTP